MVLEDRAPLIVAVTTLFFVITNTVFALRVYVRAVMRGGWGYDDYLMVVAWIFGTVMSALIFAGCSVGFGVHLYNIHAPQAQIFTALKYFTECELIYLVASAFLKMSILYALRRIAIKKWYIYSLAFMATLSVISSGVCMIYILVRCKPIAKSWNPLLPGHCGAEDILIRYIYMVSAFSILIDWYCAITPAFIIWPLQMNIKSKILIAGLLSLGVFASVTTILRLQQIINLTNPDFLFANTDVIIWSILEIDIGIIAGSVATLRPLIERMLPKGMRISTKSRKSAYNSKSYGSRKGHTQISEGGGEQDFELIVGKHPKKGSNVTSCEADALEKGGASWTNNTASMTSHAGSDDGGHGGITVTKQFQVTDTDY